jgi:hypothetical protein
MMVLKFNPAEKLLGYSARCSSNVWKFGKDGRTSYNKVNSKNFDGE